MPRFKTRRRLFGRHLGKAALTVFVATSLLASATIEATPAQTEPPSSSEKPANGVAAPVQQSDDKKEEKAGTPATVVDGQQLESVLGLDAVTAKGENMGRIVDIIVDHAGQARAAIIDFGGFLGVGSRKIAVDWRDIHFPGEAKSSAVVVDLTRDQLRVAPAYKSGEPVVVIGGPPAKP
jgi:hypothetical protein